MSECGWRLPALLWCPQDEDDAAPLSEVKPLQGEGDRQVRCCTKHHGSVTFMSEFEYRGTVADRDGACCQEACADSSSPSRADQAGAFFVWTWKQFDAVVLW